MDNLTFFCQHETVKLSDVTDWTVNPSYALSYCLANSPIRGDWKVKIIVVGKSIGSYPLKKGDLAFPKQSRTKKDIKSLPLLEGAVLYQVIAYLAVRTAYGKTLSLEGLVSRGLLFALMEKHKISSLELTPEIPDNTMTVEIKQVDLLQYWTIVKTGLTPITEKQGSKAPDETEGARGLIPDNGKPAKIKPATVKPAKPAKPATVKPAKPATGLTEEV